jgi:hypothetical protein
MTNREAIRRLSVNAGDCSAAAWLHHNNIEVIHAVVMRYFGTGPDAERAEFMLMQRLSERARSFEPQENPDEWLTRCVAAECNRLRNEAVHDKANRH